MLTTENTEDTEAATPETDAAVTTFTSISKLKRRFECSTGKVSAEFARRLERERDEWYYKAHANVAFTLEARAERDEARAQVKELIYIAGRAIDLADLDLENDKFGVVSELRDGLEKIKEETK